MLSVVGQLGWTSQQDSEEQSTTLSASSAHTVFRDCSDLVREPWQSIPFQSKKAIMKCRGRERARECASVREQIEKVRERERERESEG